MIAKNVLQIFGHLILAVAVLVAAFILFTAVSAPGGANVFELAIAIGVLLGGAVVASLFLAIGLSLARLEGIEAEAKKQTERLEYLSSVQYEALSILKPSS